MDSSLFLILTIILAVGAFGCFKAMSDIKKQEGNEKKSDILMVFGMVLAAAAFFCFFTYDNVRDEEEKIQQSKEHQVEVDRKDEEAKEHGFDSYEEYEVDKKQRFDAYYNCVEGIKSHFPYGANDKLFHGSYKTWRGEHREIQVTGNNMQVTNAFNAKRYIEYSCKCTEDGSQCEINAPFNSNYRIPAPAYNYENDIKRVSKTTGSNIDIIEKMADAAEKIGISKKDMLNSFLAIYKQGVLAYYGSDFDLIFKLDEIGARYETEDLLKPQKVILIATEAMQTSDTKNVLKYLQGKQQYDYKKDLLKTAEFTGVDINRIQKWVDASVKCSNKPKKVEQKEFLSSFRSKPYDPESFVENMKKFGIEISVEDTNNPEKVQAALLEMIYKQHPQVKCRIDYKKIMEA